MTSPGNSAPSGPVSPIIPVRYRMQKQPTASGLFPTTLRMNKLEKKSGTKVGCLWCICEPVEGAKCTELDQVSQYPVFSSHALADHSGPIVSRASENGQSNQTVAFSLTSASSYGLFNSENIFCDLHEAVLIPFFFLSFFFFNAVAKQPTWGLF